MLRNDFYCASLPLILSGNWTTDASVQLPLNILGKILLWFVDYAKHESTDTCSGIAVTRSTCGKSPSRYMYFYHPHMRTGNNYRPQTKLRKGNVFTSMCQEFCPQGGVCHTLPWQADTPPGRQTPPWADPPQADTPRADTPPPADGYCSGRCTFYWNAFLFHLSLSVSLSVQAITF